jgi:hypothetical protein
METEKLQPPGLPAEQDAPPAPSAAEAAPQQDAAATDNATDADTEAGAQDTITNEAPAQQDAGRCRNRKAGQRRATTQAPAEATASLYTHVVGKLHDLAARMGVSFEAIANEGELFHEALDRHLDDLFGAQASSITGLKTALSKSDLAVKSFTSARAPFKDGIYDNKLTERREQFQNGRLVFAMGKDLLDQLGPTALPHQYRGTWGSFNDVPQG